MTLPLLREQLPVLLACWCGRCLLCGQVTPQFAAAQPPHGNGVILSQLFQAAVRAWEPERGLLTSMKLWEAVPPSKKVPNFGWLKHLSTKYSIPHIVRTQFEVKPINGAGNLINAMGDDTHLVEDQDTTRVQELVTAITSG